MKRFRIEELDLLDFGNTRQLWGALYAGRGEILVLPFPDEEETDALTHEVSLLPLDTDGWVRLLDQTDYMNVRMPNKAIFRKSQRQIDASIAWIVYRRDEFLCRYCGGAKPLSVDHVDRWENGGATVPANLISACRPCNRTRGDTEYPDWLRSADYRKRAEGLTPKARGMNESVLSFFPELAKLRVAHQRSR